MACLVLQSGQVTTKYHSRGWHSVRSMGGQTGMEFFRETDRQYALHTDGRNGSLCVNVQSAGSFYRESTVLLCEPNTLCAPRRSQRLGGASTAQTTQQAKELRYCLTDLLIRVATRITPPRRGERRGRGRDLTSSKQETSKWDSYSAKPVP